MNKWEQEKAWTELFKPCVRMAVAPYVVNIRDATLEEDIHENTDLFASSRRIAMRVRKYEYLLNYRYDVTIRSRLDSGTETELSKIMRGWGDLMFYGFAAKGSNTNLCRWTLIDLAGFRTHRADGALRIPEDIPNGDGSWFQPYDTRLLAGLLPQIVVAAWTSPDAEEPEAGELPLFAEGKWVAIGERTRSGSRTERREGWDDRSKAQQRLI